MYKHHEYVEKLCFLLRKVGHSWQRWPIRQRISKLILIDQFMTGAICSSSQAHGCKTNRHKLPVRRAQAKARVFQQKGKAMIASSMQGEDHSKRRVMIILQSLSPPPIDQIPSTIHWSNLNLISNRNSLFVHFFLTFPAFSLPLILSFIFNPFSPQFMLSFNSLFSFPQLISISSKTFMLMTRLHSSHLAPHSPVHFWGYSFPLTCSPSFGLLGQLSIFVSSLFIIRLTDLGPFSHCAYSAPLPRLISSV